MTDTSSAAGERPFSGVRTIQVTFDCAEPGRLAEFWCHALGYRMDRPPQGFATWPEALAAWGIAESQWDARSACSDPAGVGPRLFFQRVPEGKQVKNRVHLDVRAAPGLTGDARRSAILAESERLVAHGGSRLRTLEADGIDEFLVVMADPEGNEFCLD